VPSTSTIRCVDGIWYPGAGDTYTRVPPMCYWCPSITVDQLPPHAVGVGTCNREINPGETCNIECEPGYKLVGMNQCKPGPANPYALKQTCERKHKINIAYELFQSIAIVF
jgi:hypothetical protein